MMKCQVKIAGHAVNGLKIKGLLLKISRIAELGEIVLFY